MDFRPHEMIDAYKYGHICQYPEGTEYVYSNLTPRASRIEGIDKVVFLGLQAFLDDLTTSWNRDFFERDIDVICAEFEQNTTEVLGPNNVGSDQLRQLHALGYLPLEFKAIPEGLSVPLKTPMFTVENTHKDFFWLTNYLEDRLSCSIWLPCTSATQAKRFRTMLLEWAEKTGDPSFVDYQAHDFSFRGMGSLEEAAASGAGHLASFVGSDTIIAKEWIKYHYGATEPILNSVPATEHSVMCSEGPEGEAALYKRLITDVYPEGFISIVSDTYDLWNVVNEILPSMREEIMSRNGKVVIRPDSGDPADILCGTARTSAFGLDGAYDTSEEKGLIHILWERFGGETNEKGYKVLPPQLGAIYGDGMTYDRMNNICERLEAKGFASTNVVFGIGSYTYRFVTRDTFGFAMKATANQVNGEERLLFKDPKTDSGLKKSHKGRIVVVAETEDEAILRADPETLTQDDIRLKVIDGLTRDEQESYGEYDLLQTVWLDGEFVKEVSFDDIRRRVRDNKVF